MKALITGVDGFVGKYLSEYLSEQGYEVYGTTILENYENDKINVKRMNLLDKEQVDEVIENIKPDKVFHLAGQSAVGLSWKSPVLTVNVNVNGTLNILEAIKKHSKDSKILIIGSSDQYGPVKPEECPINEEKIQDRKSVV